MQIALVQTQYRGDRVPRTYVNLTAKTVDFYVSCFASSADRPRYLEVKSVCPITFWRAVRVQHASAVLPVQREWALQRVCVCVRGGRTCTSCTPSRNGRCENLSTSETDKARSTTELELSTRPTQQFIESHAINVRAEQIPRNNLLLATGL